MENIEKPNQLELKEQADVSLSKAKEIILNSIPNDEIVSIYVKGSYVQDELQPDSDVDVVVILKSEEYLLAVYELTEKFGKTTKPPFQIVAYTLEELQTGKWSSNRTKTPTTISAFVKHLDQFPLLYGSKPEGKLFTRTDIKDLTALISAFEKSFLPDFEKGIFKFSEIVKSVMWLTEREQRALGIVPDYSWQKLSDSIKDENHIIHLALKLRRQKEVSKEEQAVFMEKLKNYLSSLKEKYQKENDKK
ncbi:MAG: nucleotidyltransferase domain-containing protein [Candidatus Paceibacterota bacterium]|jgi:predicted nucleotidyltransferase